MRNIFLILFVIIFSNLRGQNIKFNDLSKLVGINKTLCSELLTTRGISFKAARTTYKIEAYEYRDEERLTVVDVFYDNNDIVFKVEMSFIDESDQNFVNLEKEIKINYKKTRYFLNEYYYTEYLFGKNFIYITRGKWVGTNSGKSMGTIIVSSSVLWD